VTYIGTCDADDGVVESPAQATNTVALTMRAICASGNCIDTTPQDLIADNDIGDWQNPCTEENPCELTAPCVENQDTTVTFNITVLREANQGFFDIVVNFEDVFCSAKLDCFPSLLPNPYGDPPGMRDSTVVVGFACTGGSGSDTHVYFNQGSFVCVGGVNHALSINFETNGLEIGNRDHNYTVSILDFDTGIDAPFDDTADPLIFQHTYYRGIEELDELNKIYSNIAYGFNYDGIAAALDDNVTGCTYVNTMTASDGVLPADWVYPKVQFCADVGPSCGPYPLNGPQQFPTLDPYNPAGPPVAGGVFTSYVNPNGDENSTLCGSEMFEDYSVCIQDSDGNLTACSPATSGGER
jgi:hypothetical protein